MLDHPDHDHEHEHGGSEDVPEVRADHGAQSLADALRVSFRVLTATMVIVVFVYLATGIQTVQPGKAGIVKLLGRVLTVKREGLAYTWPFPVGSIELIPTAEQEVTIDEFWMHEAPQERTIPLADRRPVSDGLRPGWDGALLTGDRNLLHVRLGCTYAIADPLACKAGVLAPRGAAPAGGSSGADASDPPAGDVVRAAVCAAAIRAAACRTADAIQRTQQESYKADIHRDAQRRLDALGVGIRIRQISLKGITWPLRALPAYMAAQKAVNEAERLENAARARAESILNDAAGASYRTLVGDPGATGRAVASRPGEEAAAEYDLIGRYGAARQAGDEATAAAILERIDQVLVDRQTGGRASEIIAEARSYRTQIEQGVRGRADRFLLLLPEYEKAPQFMLQRLWAETRDEILSSPTVEKIYLDPAQGKTVLRISQDPRIRREISSEELKAEEKK